MNVDFGSWLLGMSQGTSALGGMLVMAHSIFIVLAATTFGSALLYAMSGLGFAVLAAPLFLLFLDPARAIQLVIIISMVLSIVVLRGLLPALALEIQAQLTARRQLPPKLRDDCHAAVERLKVRHRLFAIHCYMQFGLRWFATTPVPTWKLRTTFRAGSSIGFSQPERS